MEKNDVSMHEQKVNFSLKIGKNHNLNFLFFFTLGLKGDFSQTNVFESRHLFPHIKRHFSKRIHRCYCMNAHFIKMKMKWICVFFLLRIGMQQKDNLRGSVISKSDEMYYHDYYCHHSTSFSNAYYLPNIRNKCHQERKRTWNIFMRLLKVLNTKKCENFLYWHT